MHSSRVKPLRDAAQRTEDSAVQRLVERQHALAAQEKKLGELRGYAEDYSRPPSAALSVPMARSRREFLERLRQAVALQEVAVQKARLACEQERARWLAAHRSTEVLDRLAEHLRAGESRAHERRLSREHDEVAVQRWLAAKREE